MTTIQAASALPAKHGTQLTGNRVLRLPRVMELTGLSRSTIYARMANATFPRSILLGARAIGWLAFDIDEWIDERVAESRKETQR